MPTIKTKKEMNLAELIEYIAETEYKTESYTSNDNGAVVGVGLLKGIFINGTIFPNHTFTVEIEEEITENSKLYLVERYISSYEGFKLKYRTHPNRSIKSILEYNQSHLKTTHVYAEVNNELALIWTKEKGLVD